MARPDQLAKRHLRESTAPLTHHLIACEAPAEVPVGPLLPDVVLRVVAPDRDLLATLPAPWSLLRHDATVDVKMPGDHLAPATLERCDFRRHARWLHWIESEHLAHRDVPVELAADWATWVVAPYVARWLLRPETRGPFALDQVAQGCYLLARRPHDVLWVAANELPLIDALTPFLIARSGRPQREFLHWAAAHKGLDWTLSLLEELTVDTHLFDDFVDVPRDDESQRRIKTEYARRMLQFYPEAGVELVEVARRSEARRALRRVLARRGLAVTAENDARIDACNDVAEIERWHDQAIVASSADEALTLRLRPSLQRWIPPPLTFDATSVVPCRRGRHGPARPARQAAPA